LILKKEKEQKHMNRDFNDNDRRKKKARIKLPENPANLPENILQKLEEAITQSLKDGYLSCPRAWKIARDFNIPRIAVGAAMDKLAVRVTDCQIGFFKIDKTPYEGFAPQEKSPEIIAALRDLDAKGELTCSAIFELARFFKTAPLKISEASNVLGLKIRNCQLGCF